MFRPREIVYGYARWFREPHNKYLVTIYQDEELNIVACFTTSKDRAGVPPERIRHGAVSSPEGCEAYVFERGRTIGTNPETGEPFSFPLRTTVTFDYGVREAQRDFFVQEFTGAKVVCVLNEEEYMNLVYAMYISPHTSERHRKVLDRIMQEHYGRQ